MVGNATQYWSYGANTAEKEYVTKVRDSQGFTWETLYKNALNGINKFEKVTSKSELPSWCTDTSKRTDDGYAYDIYFLAIKDENLKNISWASWYND